MRRRTGRYRDVFIAVALFPTRRDDGRDQPSPPQTSASERLPRRHAGSALLLLAAASISCGIIAAKRAYAEGADPRGLLAIRLVVAAPLLALLIPWAIRRRNPVMGLAPLLTAAAAGAVLWIAYRAELEGLARLPAGLLVLLLVTTPAWVAAFRWLGFQQAPTRIEGTAILVVIAGVAIMVNPIQSSLDPTGVLAGLVSAVTFALFVLILDQNRSVPAEVGFPVAMIGATALMLVTDPTAIGPIVGNDAVLGLGLIVGASAAAWAALFAIGLHETSAVTAATVTAVEPVFVAVLAFILLGEQLSAREIAGGIVVLAGIVMAAVGPRQATVGPIG